MLVLSRKREQKIVIGDERIIITVLEIRGNHVRIGVEADRNIPVVRGELTKAPPDPAKEAAA